MPTEIQEQSIVKRKLILKDSLAFLALVAITIALFAVTLFLFRSFEAHRADLSERWADRGLAAIAAHNPEQAVTAYRTALSYNPDERSYELLLAQSLGAAGHTEEAYTYFLGLWETRPGDGFINLQLARLAAQKRDQQTAINDYRAAIYGTWEGDGVDRRREVRFELARYLIAQGQPAAARAELLVAGGNAPDTLAIDLSLADLLQHAASPADALAFYQKALAHDPKNLEALTNAARISFSTGNYSAARRLLERALREDPKNEANTTLLANSVRILQLTPADTLPAKERVSRILTDRAIARKRWTECAATTPQPSPLTTRWASPDAAIPRNVLLHDPDKQAATLQLLYDTEIKASQICTAPTGDDALLLLLAQAAQAEEASHP